MKTKKKLFVALTLSVALLSGCAPKNWNLEEEGAYDPIEPINRGSFALNKGLDTILFKPLARLYDLSPDLVKDSVGNFFGNLEEPVSTVNHALQLNGGGALTSTSRFLINSTIGIGGLLDLASIWEIEEQETDFGRTLRTYGLNNTAYIVLPLFGPSTIADSIGGVADSFISPTQFVDLSDGIEYGLDGLEAVHQRADILPITDAIEENAVDEYIAIRDLYESRRQDDDDDDDDD